MDRDDYSISTNEAAIVFTDTGAARLIIGRDPDSESVPPQVMFCAALAMWIQEKGRAEEVLRWFVMNQHRFTDQLPFTVSERKPQ